MIAKFINRISLSVAIASSSFAFAQVGPAGPGSMGQQQGWVPQGMAPAPYYNAAATPGAGGFGAARGVGELLPQMNAQNSTAQAALTAGCVTDRNGNTRLVNQGGAAIALSPTAGH